MQCRWQFQFDFTSWYLWRSWIVLSSSWNGSLWINDTSV